MNETHTQLVPAEKAPANPVLRDLVAVHDIPMRISIEVGRLKMSVGDFLRLDSGAVLEVKKPAGEPFEVSINGTVVAKGEVIMIEQSSGVRIVEVLKPAGTA